MMEQSKLKELFSTVAQNTSLLTWIILPSIALGGATFIVYFASIGYMPELDIQKAVYQIYTAALTGLLLFSAFSIAVIIPGLFYENWIKQSPFKEKIEGDSFGFIRLSLSQTFLIVGLSLLATPAINLNQSSPNIPLLNLLALTLLGFFLAFIGICLVKDVIQSDKEKNIKQKKIKLFSSDLRSKKLWISVLYSCTNYMFVITFFSYASVGTDALVFMSKNTGRTLIFLISIPIILIIFNKLAIEVAPKKGIMRFITFLLSGLFSVAIIQALFSDLSFLPSRIVKIYGWGNISNVNIVLNQEGCEVVKYLELNTVKKEEEDKLCKLEKVHILSRFGEKYYLRLETKNTSVLDFEIPVSMIHSWSVSRIPQGNP